jgi:NADH-quinone oxidoreductase subunit E
MSRLSPENLEVALEILSRYPVKKSALIPLLHLAQEQDGWVADDAMEHIAELVECTPAEVIGTCTFYEMFKRKPVGRYMVNICTNISCQLLGGEELLHHAEHALGVKAGGTTPDGLFTIEDVECIAACTEAPCLQINYRYFHKITTGELDQVLDDLRAGTRDDIPPHGTLAKVRQHIPSARKAGNVAPTDRERPVWLARNDEPQASTKTGGA